jgi:hypothetical protein
LLDTVVGNTRLWLESANSRAIVAGSSHLHEENDGMRTILGRMRNILAVALALTVVLPAARAKGIEDFTLTKAIPADAFLALHARDHEGKEFVNKQFARVWEEVERVHFDRDLKRLFKSIRAEGLPPGTEPEGFEEQWQQMYDLWTAVDWASLGKREFAMGMKLGFPTTEFVLLFMPPQDQLKDSFEGLGGVLKTLVGLSPESFQLTTQEDGETVIHNVAVVNAAFPVSLTLARHGEVILVGFGPTICEQTLALLRGEGGEPLASSARFKEAFQKLPTPTDELVFCDIARLMGQLRMVVNGAMAMVEASAPAEGEEGHEDFLKWKALPDKILDGLDIFEYSAGVTRTDGMKTTADSITVLRDDAPSRALYPVIANNKPLADPLKYVPENAGEFSVCSGIDLPALYQAVMKVIREDVPGGQGVIDGLETMKAESGWDLENDIIGWIGGGFMSFSVPGPTPYSPSDFVVMLSVRDEAKAREIIDRLVALIEPMLVSQNGSIVDAEIEGVEGFKTVVHPMLAMLPIGKPTIGVKDGWLFIGSSPDIILTTTEVAAGKLANFSKNERFLKEGIPPEGSVTSLSFTDLTKLGEELGSILQMVPIIGMMAPDLMKDPKMQSLLSIVGKAGRVVRKLDFFQSSASRTTFDGKMFVTKSIITYREPPVPMKPKPVSETEEQEQEQESETPERQ